MVIVPLHVVVATIAIASTGSPAWVASIKNIDDATAAHSKATTPNGIQCDNNICQRPATSAIEVIWQVGSHVRQTGRTAQTTPIVKVYRDIRRAIINGVLHAISAG